MKAPRRVRMYLATGVIPEGFTRVSCTKEPPQTESSRSQPTRAITSSQKHDDSALSRRDEGAETHDDSPAQRRAHPLTAFHPRGDHSGCTRKNAVETSPRSERTPKKKDGVHRWSTAAARAPGLQAVIRRLVGSLSHPSARPWRGSGAAPLPPSLRDPVISPPSAGHGRWRPPLWEYPNTEVLDFSNLLVPTMDSTRALFLLRMLHKQRKAVLMVGAEGTAKTSTALMFFTELDPVKTAVKR